MLDVLDNGQNGGQNGGLEKFELLSAYLDGEVTMAERKQVDLWLQEDASFKAMYSKMRGMHTAIEQIPLPPVTESINKFADQVFAKIDQRRQFKFLKVVGGACVAGMVAAGAVFTATFQGSNHQLQMAKSVLPTSVPNSLSILVKPAPLMVALNDSIVQISPNKVVTPKAKADIIDLLEDGDDL
jgi:predicted anti-sigma-YlaC factor YlaD